MARSYYERSDVVLDRGRLAHTHIRVGGELGDGKWPGNDRQTIIRSRIFDRDDPYTAPTLISNRPWKGLVY